MILHERWRIVVLLLVLRWWQAMRDAVCRRVAMVAAMFHVMRCRRQRSSVRARCGRILSWVGRSRGRTLLMRRVVGVGSVHGRRRDMAGAVVLIVCVVLAFPRRLVRIVCSLSEWREVVLVGRRTRRRIRRLNGWQRRARDYGWLSTAVGGLRRGMRRVNAGGWVGEGRRRWWACV